MNKSVMNHTPKLLLAAMTACTLALGTLGGCAVARDQSTTGEYIDDSAITAKVKSRFVESSAVDASSITVETLKGMVQLSGFAKSADEKATAEKLAKGVSGVSAVKNNIIVKP